MAVKPSTKNWRVLPTDKWNTTTVHAFLIERHRELFNVDYVPFRGWQAEKGLIKTLLDKHGSAVIRKFCEVAITEYQATPQYPGTSFGWLWTYRANTFQRVQALIAKEKAVKERVTNDLTVDEMIDLL